jgi:hypothetical protein
MVWQIIMQGIGDLRSTAARRLCIHLSRCKSYVSIFERNAAKQAGRRMVS